MQLEPRHYWYIGFALLGFALVVMMAYDVCGIFSSPGLMQE